MATELTRKAFGETAAPAESVRVVDSSVFLPGGVQLTRRAAAALALNLSSTVLVFAGTLVLARLLGSEGYGYYATIVALINLLTVQVLFGLDRLLTREIAARAPRNQWGYVNGLIRRSNQTVLLIGCIVALVSGLVASVLTNPTGSFTTALWIGLLSLPLLALSRLRQATLAGLHHAIAGQVPETLIRPALITLLPIPFALILGQAFGTTAAMAIYLLATATSFFIGSLLLWQRLPRPIVASRPTYDTRRWLATAVELGMAGGLVIALSQIDLLLLGALAGPEPAGPYAVALRAATLVVFGLLAVGIPLAPSMSRLWSTKELVPLQALLTRAARLTMLVALPVTVLLVALGESFLAFFGNDFVAAAPALAVLSVGQLAHAAAGPAGLLLLMTGHHRQAALAAGVAVLVNVTLCLLLIPHLGAVGAAVSSAVAYGSWASLQVVYASRRLNLHTTAVGAFEPVRLRRTGPRDE